MSTCEIHKSSVDGWTVTMRKYHVCISESIIDCSGGVTVVWGLGDGGLERVCGFFPTAHTHQHPRQICVPFNCAGKEENNVLI